MRTKLALLLTAILVALPSAATAVTPVRVLDSRGASELSGTLHGDRFGWTANSAQRPKTFRGYVSEAGGLAHKIKIAGDLFVGDVILDGPRAGQVVVTANDLRGGDIRFADLLTQEEVAAPDGINTRRRETGGTVSGDYLAFTRYYGNTRRDVLLYQFSTDTLTTIAEGWFFVTQVNGDYVSYTRCTNRTCDVWRYRISTGTTNRMPRAARGRANYYPAVGADGTVYYVQGDYDDCGRNTKILRWNAGDVSQALKVQDGTELGTLNVGNDGLEDVLLFGEINCRNGDWGIYRIPLG